MNYEDYILFQDYLSILQNSSFAIGKRGKMTPGTTDLRSFIRYAGPSFYPIQHKYKYVLEGSQIEYAA